MLVNFSGIFIFGLLLRIILALYSSYNPHILLGIASNDAMGFVQLGKQFANNFTLEDALILLINIINNDIQIYSKNWNMNIPIYEFYQILGNLKEISIKYINNKIILDWELE